MFNKSNKLKFYIIILMCFIAFSFFTKTLAYDLGSGTADGQQELQSGSQGLAYYAGQILKFGIVIAAILAVVMIVIAGFQFITAGGNPGAITSAQDRIQNALVGLLLVVGSWLILYTINPDLININLESISTFQPVSTGEPNIPTMPQIPEEVTLIGSNPAIRTTVYTSDQPFASNEDGNIICRNFAVLQCRNIHGQLSFPLPTPSSETGHCVFACQY